MLIVIEGVDRTGKTTLAQAISKRFGYVYKHFGPPKGRAADEYVDFLLALDKPTVCDRFYLGELVYGPLLRGKAAITPLELLTIERLMRLKQAILIHAITDIKLANERLAVSEENEVVDAVENKRAAEAFKAIVANANISTVLTYDGRNRRNLASMLTRLKPLLYPEPEQGYTGIGTVGDNKLVFVGEQVNKNATWRSLPFDKGLSSTFLMKVFNTAGVDEKKVYICNADKLEAIEAEALAVNGATFISLGVKADKKLDALNVEHEVLPHPQWVKRFRYNDSSKYVSELRAILRRNSHAL